MVTTTPGFTQDSQAPGGLNVERLLAGAARVGVSEQVAAQAAANLMSGRSVFFVVSGKLASGKDTVAPAVLTALGLPDAVHMYYAKYLKDEVDAVITSMRAWQQEARPASLTARRRLEVARRLSVEFSFDLEHGQFFAGRLLTQALTWRAIHARSRTAVIRQALQYHGTEVRRAQDQDYWVKRAVAPALELLAAGASVYFTDARFPNEVAGARDVGAFAARIDISSEVQTARLVARDGEIQDPAALLHKSETSLDDYDGFDVRVDNSGALAPTVATIVEAMRGTAAAAA